MDQGSFRGHPHPKAPIPIIYVILAFLQTAVTSGIIFGWPALQLVFTKEGTFASHCKPTETMRPCPAQTMYFNTIYTAGIFANNISCFFNGAFLDKFGPKWTNFVGYIIFMCGCIPFILKLESIYVVGFAMLGFSGPAVYVSIMHLSNLFPGNQSFVLSVFSGTFATSSLVFKIFQLLYKPNSWFDIPHLFIALVVVLGPLALIGVIVWPRLPFTPVFLSDENAALVGPQNSSHRKKRSPLYNASLKNQLLSWEFFIPSLWIALQALHIHTYIGGVNPMFMDEENYITTFNWIWLGGVLAIPFFGVLVDKCGTTFSFLVCSIMFLLFSISSLIPILPVQYLTFALVSGTNVGVWGVLYTYFFNVFGVKNYGKILGTCFGLIAAIGLLQYPILSVSIYQFHYNFTYMNILFAALSVLLFVEPIFLWRVDTKRRIAREWRSLNSDSSANSDGP